MAGRGSEERGVDRRAEIWGFEDPPVFRPPQQSRSNDTFQCFLTATYELLLDQTPEDLRVSDIVERAHRPNGSFYARFPSKWAAVDAVLCQVMEQRSALADRYLDSASSLPLESLLERYVGFVQATYRSSLVPIQAMILRSVQRPDLFNAARRRWGEIAERWIEMVSALDIEHPYPEEAAATAFGLVQSVVWWEHLYGPYDGVRPIDSDLLVDLALTALGKPPTVPLAQRSDPILVAGSSEDRTRPRPPRQRRGREARRAFVDAFEELLDTRDYEDITVGDIARRAHRSNGSFYGIFRDKDDCFVALLDERLSSGPTTADGARDLTSTLRRQPMPTSIARGIDVAVQRALTPTRLHKSYALRAITDGVVRDHFRRQRAAMAAPFRDLVLDHPCGGPPNRLPGLVYLVVISSLDQAMLHEEGGIRPVLGREALAGGLTDVSFRILGIERTGSVRAMASNA